MPNGVKLDENTFESLGHSEQNTVLFKNTERILTTITDFKLDCDDKFRECDKKIKDVDKRHERRKYLDKGIAFIGGVVGGIIAVFTGIGK